MGYSATREKVDTSNFGNHYQLYAPGMEIATTSGASGYKQNGKKCEIYTEECSSGFMSHIIMVFIVLLAIVV